MNARATQSPRRRNHASAFTLLEVMVSIAIVLILILGVNQVFKVAADTVGTGQALSAKIRDGRAAQAVFTNELAHLAPDGPFLIIDSHTMDAYRSEADAKSDLDGNPLTIDIDGNNNEGEPGVPGEIVNRANPSDRNHRQDMLSFFTRDLYPRQTGNTGVYVANESSNEAWVTYGHLRIYDGKNNPDVDGSYIAPGQVPTSLQPNPKNYYADDWVLGRVVMLLTQPDSATGKIYDRTPTPPPPPYGISQTYWQQQAAAAYPLSPLQTTTPASDGSGITLTDARYDLVGTSISNFRSLLSTYIQHTKYNTGGTAVPPAQSIDDWWTLLPVTSLSSSPAGTYQRFRCNPYPAKPLDSRQLAQTVPALMNNCTQFIVEFAGDYLTQGDPKTNDTSSDIKAFQPDGQIDYYFDHPSGSTGPAIRHIRWYGFPRDINGDGYIPGPNAVPPAGISKYDNMVDVIPVRDAMMSATTVTFDPNTPPTPNPDAFERHLTNDIVPPRPISLPVRIDYANPATGVQQGETYTAAWGPNDTNRPKMIRIIATVDDPNGRLGVGQTYEYVINLP